MLDTPDAPTALCHGINLLDALPQQRAVDAITATPDLALLAYFQKGMTERDVLLHVTDLQMIHAVARVSSATLPAAHILLTGTIDDSVFNDFATLLRTGAYAAVHIYIDSPGGDSDHAEQIYQLLRQLDCPVHTYALGHVDSAALLIFIAGHHRHAAPLSRFLIHPTKRCFRLRKGVSDDLEIRLGRSDALDMAASLQRTMIDLAEICTARTGIPSAIMLKWQEAETHLDAEQARSYNLATRIVPIVIPPPSSDDTVVWLGLPGGHYDRDAVLQHVIKNRAVTQKILRELLYAAIRTQFRRWHTELATDEASLPVRVGAALWRRKGKLLIGTIAAGAIVYAALPSTAPPPLPYTCEGAAQTCAAVWLLHTNLNQAAETTAAGHGMISAIYGPFSVHRLRLVPSVDTHTIIDQYQIDVRLNDGTSITALEPIIHSPALPDAWSATLPTIRAIGWRVTADLSAALQRAATVGLSALPTSIPGNGPSHADLRRELEAIATVNRYPLQLPPPSASHDIPPLPQK